MKLLQLPVKILLIVAWSLLATNSVRSQTGNMSDITLPNPNEMITDGPDVNQGDSNTVDGEVTPTEGNTADGEVTPTEGNTADGEVTPTEGNTADGEVTPTEGNTADGEVTPTEGNTADGEVTPTEGNTADGEVTPTEGNTADGEVTQVEEGDSGVGLSEKPAGDSSTIPEETGTSNAAEDSNDNLDSSSETANQDSTSEVEVGDRESSQAIQEEPEVVENTPNVDESPAEASTPATEESPATENADVTDRTTEKTNSPADVEANQTADVQKVESETAPEETTSETEVTEEPTPEEATDEAEAAEKPAPEKEEEAKEQEEKETAEEKNSDADVGQIDRVAYETQFQDAPADLAIQMQEELQLTQLISSSGLQLYGKVPSVQNISRRLGELEQQTGKKAAFINISLQKNQLESFVVLPDETKSAAAKSSTVASTNLKTIDSPKPKALTVRKTVKDTNREDLIAIATQFREQVSNARNLQDVSYKKSAEELYQVLIEPIEAELKANNIDILVFSMDSGLRLLPLAALYDGKQFLVEKYATAIVPSFGLTDTRYVNPTKSSILAMGASEFTDQESLPTMGIELETIVSDPRKGEAFLNEQFTIPNFIAQNSRENPFSIIHLGTHAEFKAGDLSDSYIQFYDDKLRIPQLQDISTELGWNTANTPVDLLVLSACDTAIGDEKAELGFAGLAVQAGVKSALASLWYVSDLGTLALMGEFYNQLDSTLIKAEALRQTQLEMLYGKVNINDRRVDLSNGEKLTLPKEFPEGNLSLAHPYFWSSFTLIGNWN